MHIVLFIKSIGFLLKSPSLWIHILLPMILLGIIGIIVTILLFVFALPQQQSYILTIIPDYQLISWILAILLTLFESATIVLILSFSLQKSQDRIFDYTLKKKCPQLFLNSEDILDPLPIAVPTYANIKSLAVFITSLPINAIPVAGQILFFVINGYVQGPAIHARYFKMKKWSDEAIERFVDHHRKEYWQFGIIKTILEIVPIANIVGLYVSSVAAALMAADFENRIAANAGISNEGL